MTDIQKHQLIQAILTAVITIVIAAAAIFGYSVTQPTPGVSVLSTNQKITTSRDGSTLNVLAGGQLNAAASSTVVLNGAVLVNSTPLVPFATLVATPTPATNVVATSVLANSITGNTGVYTTSVSIAGTPVVPFATPQTLFMSSVAKRAQECGVVSVTNTATLTPVTANLTPIAVVASLNQAATGDAAKASASFSGNVITLAVIGTNSTPTANTTPASVAYCLVGSTP